MTVRYSSLIFILVSLSPVLGEECLLHRYLTDVEQWETHVSFIGKLKQSFLRFRGQFMNETTYSPLGETEIQRECVTSYADNKYLYKWTDESSTLFRCYQLIPVSSNVIVMKLSDTVSDRRLADGLCSAVRYSDWPLISTEKRPDAGENVCGIEGGFDFYVRLNDMDYCQGPETLMRPRLEVGCFREPGMHLDFRNNFNCRGFLEMTLQQSLVCLGSWDRGPYRFSVVTDDADLWPKIWLLRFPRDTSVGPSFEMVVLPDIEMDMAPTPAGNGVSYIHTLVVKRTDFVTVCEDEATENACDSLCSEDYEAGDLDLDEKYCQKSCGQCPKDQGECVFPAEIKGEWLEFGEAGTRRVALASSLLYVDGLPPLKCLNLTGNVANRQPLLTFYGNGCRPHYMCVYLQVRGPNVMQYGMSEAFHWPYKNSLTAPDICDNERFGYPSSVQRNPDQGILIKLVGKKPVDCEIRGTFLFSGERFESDNKKACSGTITSCDFIDVFSIEYHKDCNEESQSYQCIASFEDGQSRILITEGEDRLGGLQQCWVMHRFKGDAHTTVYQVPLQRCRAPRPRTDRRRENVDDDYVMMYNVSAELELRDETTCAAPPPPPTTTSRSELSRYTSAKPASFTRKIDLVTQHIPPNTPTTEKPYNISDASLKASSAAGYVEASVLSLLLLLLLTLPFYF